MRRPTRSFTIERKKGARAGQDKAADAAPPPFEPPAPPQPKSRPADANRAAAEALFKAPARATGATDAPERRILQSLEEAPPKFENYQPLAEEPKKRGRKPGSKNKPKDGIADAPKKRGRKPGSKNKPKTAEPVLSTAAWALMDDEDDVVASTTPLVVAPPRAVTAVQALRRTGRIPRAELPPGQRWKARLPRFAR
jgi:hypothetical protein